MTTTPGALPVLARDASPFARLRMAVHSLLVLKDDPSNAFYARMLQLSLDREAYAKVGQRMRAHPEWRRILEARESVPGPAWTFETLAGMPEGTLGRAYARYYLDQGIEPFTNEFVPKDEVESLIRLYRETHDIHHILTGYGIDPVGEIEVQAFYVGNLGLRHSAFLVFASLLSSRGGHQWRLIRFLRRIRAAYLRGKASPIIFGVPFNELWQSQVSDIAERYVAPARR